MAVQWFVTQNVEKILSLCFLEKLTFWRMGVQAVGEEPVFLENQLRRISDVFAFKCSCIIPLESPLSVLSNGTGTVLPNYRWWCTECNIYGLFINAPENFWCMHIYNIIWYGTQLLVV